MKKIFRILLWSLVGVLFIGTFVYLFLNSRPKETRYDIVHPAMGDIERSTILTGTIEPRDEIEIKPQVSGIISEINVPTKGSSRRLSHASRPPKSTSRMPA